MSFPGSSDLREVLHGFFQFSFFFGPISIRLVDKNRPLSRLPNVSDSLKVVVNQARVERVVIIPSDSADNVGATPRPKAAPVNVEGLRWLPPDCYIFRDCCRLVSMARTQYQVYPFSGTDVNPAAGGAKASAMV